jgi:hypothetical protein
MAPLYEEATVSGFYDAGEIVNYVSVSRDITGFLELQKERKASGPVPSDTKNGSVGRLAGGWPMT